jgi:hypothetical protein
MSRAVTRFIFMGLTRLFSLRRSRWAQYLTLEFNHGELIIKSLSTAILKVKELLMENEAFTIKWKQNTKGLRIILPDRLINDENQRKMYVKD